MKLYTGEIKIENRLQKKVRQIVSTQKQKSTSTMRDLQKHMYL